MENRFRHMAVIVTLSAWAALSACADEKAMHAIELPYEMSSIAVDGDFSDWGKIDWRDDFVFRGPARDPFQICKFALRRDRERLYLAWRMEGPYRRSERHELDDIWRDNFVLEVFFARRGSASGYQQYALAVNGDRYDGADGDGFVTLDWQSATKWDEKGWQAELSFPFSNFGVEGNFSETLRFNLAVSLPKLADKQHRRNFCWCWMDGCGYHDVSDMGYLVPIGFAAGAEVESVSFERRFGVRPAAQPPRNGDEKGYLAYRKAVASERAVRDAERVRALSAKLAARTDLGAILPQPWPTGVDFGESAVAQADIFEAAFRRGKEVVTLNFVQAVNETAHRSFALSAVKAADDLVFELPRLSGPAGAIDPSRLYVARFSFLHPLEGLEIGARPLNLPYPELVERVRGPGKLKAGESVLFRLYVDTRGAKPGVYKGVLAATAAGSRVEMPVSLTVEDFALPLPEEHTFLCHPFTTIPFAGESAELWAQFFVDHYFTDVNFEHPPVTVNGTNDTRFIDGKTGKPCSARSEAYVNGMTATNPIPPEGAVRVDLSVWGLSDRLRACARHNLRVMPSNLSGFLRSEHFPELMNALATCGIGLDNFVYKLGDEDPTLFFLPVAKRLREVVPGLNTAMIPSGSSYWDIKPAVEGYTEFTFSDAAYNGGARGQADLKFLQSRGVRVSRYLNEASVAGAYLPVSARAGVWSTLAVQGWDGYTCWTADLWPSIGFHICYGGYKWDVSIKDLPPERQPRTMLVYIRREGEIYHPVSCIRTENIRDGFIDAHYYRLAKQRLEAAGDREGLAHLGKIVRRSMTTISDFESLRRELSCIIRSENKK